MKLAWCSLALVATAHGGAMPPARAAGDLTRGEPTLVLVRLGSPQNEFVFAPSTLECETGKLYRLRLENPSPSDHYFSSQGLADAVFTRKVEVHGPDGKKIAEVYGPIRRIEVRAGGVAEWWFVPVRSGSFQDLMSTGSAAAKGMTGTIQIR